MAMKIAFHQNSDQSPNASEIIADSSAFFDSLNDISIDENVVASIEILAKSEKLNIRNIISETNVHPQSQLSIKSKNTSDYAPYVKSSADNVYSDDCNKNSLESEDKKIKFIAPKPPAFPKSKESSRKDLVPKPPKTPSNNVNVYRRKICFTTPSHSQTHPPRIETPKSISIANSSKVKNLKLKSIQKDQVKCFEEKQILNELSNSNLPLQLQNRSSQVQLTSNVRLVNNLRDNTDKETGNQHKNLDVLRSINPNLISVNTRLSESKKMIANRIRLASLKKSNPIEDVENVLYSPFELEIKEKKVLVSQEKELKETTEKLVDHLKQQIEKQLEVIELQNDQLLEQEEEIRNLRAEKKGVNLEALSKSF